MKLNSRDIEWMVTETINRLRGANIIKEGMEDTSGIYVLVACEESQAITIEFRKLGIEAYSCDLQECSGGHPEWHVQGDCLPLINGDNHTFQTVDGTQHFVPHWNLIIAHPPCFAAGTKVITYDGIKNIEDITVGEKVLTHTGQYKTVKEVMKKTTPQIAIVHTENCGYITCTPDHPFYTKNIVRKIINGQKEIVTSEFEWVSPNNFKKERNICGSIKEQTYVTSVFDETKEEPAYDGTEIGTNATSTKHVKNLNIGDSNLWYVIGRWVGDGHYYYQYHGGHKRLAGIHICCSKEETEYLKQRIEEAGLTYYLHHKRTANSFEIANKELALYMEQFGKGSDGKKIPGFVTRLTNELALAFLEGYFDADGNETNDRITFTTVSSDLAYGIKYMVNKYYGVACSISKPTANRNIIEGRKVNAKFVYIGLFIKERKIQTHWLSEDNYILSPYCSVEIKDEPTKVYNLSVEDDESYTANGLVVHNCTYLTVSGNRWFNVERYGDAAIQRLKDREEGANFFMKFVNADADHIAIENPIGYMSTAYRKPDQIIQPWMWGDNVTKTTCLWTKNLPQLEPDCTEAPKDLDYKEWTDKNGKKKRQAQWYFDALAKAKDGAERQRLRSKTFPGIAKAIATQWGTILKQEHNG